MKTHSKLVGLGLVSMLALSPALAAFAEDTATTPTAEATDSATHSATQEKLAFETSEKALDALKNIHAARLALFEGDTDAAKTLASTAVDDLTGAQSTATDLQVAADKTADKDDIYVPFDTSVTLAEGFVPTEDNKDDMTKAGEHLAQGDQQKALEVLKLAKVDVDYTALLLPVNGSMKAAQEASDQIDKGDFYQANLSLKAIEDSVVVGSFSLSDMPTQGNSAS
ncbi:YfdX family protein [Celeribacter sp. HF31]|uniref:YfdX family protein n=1 Tax=Celeribacter sp. HF31 TaxID=2721558 RepID=UPI001430A776|nr:YfdX family protein [Celeribacter sp. HF31]NIY80833.1 YfdX family protein [Celeribacter sp. HF31]